jgi:hypothetical protein
VKELVAEADRKHVLLCADCHAEVDAGLSRAETFTDRWRSVGPG